MLVSHDVKKMLTEDYPAAADGYPKAYGKEKGLGGIVAGQFRTAST